ncbi:hypothetical protein LF65_05669 [Clostridium beijerinckii]|uniref:Uncharacterized protein n=1 Tax=Clostridium beijerinckii TaxID=1520 RepID=A0A0B5QMY8_CLOBE|nr:hypothetical protein [Clostridium beijerinckii]AJH02176.1 hypothetical protein LF65_05669 [Clostridium beijerinckii]
MQLIIKNTHIFDCKVQEEFRKFIELKIDKFKDSKYYMLTIIYNAESLSSNDESEFYFDNSIYNNIQPKWRDKKDEALDTQLHKCGDILKEYGIKCYWYSIQGDDLKNKNVKIILEEDKSKGSYIEEGITISGIMPNRKAAINRVCQMFNERVSKLYSGLTEKVDNKVMCKVLDIQYTEDENIIYKAFFKEYGELGFCSDERHKELMEKLINRFRMLIELEQKNKEMLDNNDIPKGSINNI